MLTCFFPFPDILCPALCRFITLTGTLQAGSVLCPPLYTSSILSGSLHAELQVQYFVQRSVSSVFCPLPACRFRKLCPALFKSSTLPGSMHAGSLLCPSLCRSSTLPGLCLQDCRFSTLSSTLQVQYPAWPCMQIQYYVQRSADSVPCSFHCWLCKLPGSFQFQYPVQRLVHSVPC